MNNTYRFSILNLEADVLKYHKAKKKCRFYEKICDIHLINCLFNKKKNYYSKKYLKYMRLLEKKYRCTNVYTDYHRQLETK